MSFQQKNVIFSTRISLKAFHIMIYLPKGSRPLTGSCWGGTASSTGAFTWFGSYGIVCCLKMSASLQVPHPHPLVQSQKLNINSPCEPCLKAIQPSSPKKHLATKNTPPIFFCMKPSLSGRQHHIRRPYCHRGGKPGIQVFMEKEISLSNALVLDLYQIQRSFRERWRLWLVGRRRGSGRV